MLLLLRPILLIHVSTSFCYGKLWEVTSTLTYHIHSSLLSLCKQILVPCPSGFIPPKEFAESCVTSSSGYQESFNSCQIFYIPVFNEEGGRLSCAHTLCEIDEELSRGIDTINIGNTVCGQLSSWTRSVFNIMNSVGTFFYESADNDRDYFHLSLPGGAGKIKIVLELTGDMFYPYIRLVKTRWVCASKNSPTQPDLLRHITSTTTPTSTGSRFYELTADNLDASDYRIEVYPINLQESICRIGVDCVCVFSHYADDGTPIKECERYNQINPMECGSGVYSYQLSVTEDTRCIRNGDHCGKWKDAGRADEGCYADKISYDKSTAIGYSVSLLIATLLV